MCVRTTLNAGITAIDTRADLFRQCGVDGVVPFYGQIVDAQAGVQPSIAAQGAGRTDGETILTVQAVIPVGGIGRQGQGGNEFPQKHLRAQFRMNQHVVLTDKPESRAHRQRPLGQGDRIHTDFAPVSLG